jgi:hypothetical protein
MVTYSMIPPVVQPWESTTIVQEALVVSKQTMRNVSEGCGTASSPEGLPLAELFLLSVLEPHARRICEGRKLWEFRENPRFGMSGVHHLTAGDLMFIVSMGDRPEIACVCRVLQILRGDALRLHFGTRESGAWQEIGYGREEQPWCILVEEILPKSRVAIRLETFLLRRPIAVADIRHAQTGKAWSGQGFLHASQLKRYRLDGRYVEEALREILEKGVYECSAGAHAGRRAEPG